MKLGKFNSAKNVLSLLLFMGLVVIMATACSKPPALFTDIYKTEFSFPRLSHFNPGEMQLEYMKFSKIADSSFASALELKLKEKGYNPEAEFYLYSLENRQSEIQDFTILAKDKESSQAEPKHSIYYITMDKSNKIIDLSEIAAYYLVGDFELISNARQINDTTFDVIKIENTQSESGKPISNTEQFTLTIMPDGRIAKDTKTETMPTPIEETAAADKFAGEWIWHSDEVNEEKTHGAEFRIKLKVSDARIEGGFDGYNMFGNRVEGGQEAYACPIIGTIVADDQAEIEYESCYSANKGKAKLTLINNDKLKWLITEYAEDSHVPNEAILKRKK